ncbi:oxygenase MpaB family protein [Streptomyces parvus]|uniref:oxygenase MpaB family protein n=1 Tax=Streptomyces parvus TaxID=66428 RepID=UPI00363EE763
MVTAVPSPASDVERVPDEFHTYWQALEKPQVRRVRAACQALLGFDPVPTPEQVLRFAYGHYDTDPTAEAFVAEVYDVLGTAEGRRMLDTVLDEGLAAVADPPPSLVALMTELTEEPEWLDWELLERGAKVLRGFGPAVASSAGSGTLLAYTESSIAKPLSLTGAYAGASALHRFMETQRHTFDISDPGGMRQGAAGWKSSARVRVMHVFLRRRIAAHAEWDTAAWGQPINQSDAEMTLLSGSVVMALSMRAIGHPVTRRDIEALMHLWRYVGHVMGVRPRWYPQTVREAVQLTLVYFLKRAYSAGGEGIELIESYLPAFRPQPGTGWRRRIRDEVNYRVQIGYTRYWLPGSFYRSHDMPFAWPWALHPLLQIPGNLAVGVARKMNSRVDSAVDRLARSRREAWFSREMDGQESRFSAREQFRR